MDDKAWLDELSGLLKIPRYDHKIFGHKSGALVGVRDGYLLAVGLGKSDDGRSSAIRLIVRHGTADPERMKESLKPAKGSFKGLKVEPNTTAAVRTYSFGKPKPAEVSADVASLMGAVAGSVSTSAGRCEDCGREERDVILFNNVPGYHCSGCQQQIRQKLDASAMQYEARETNLSLGVLYGAGAALAGSVAWGGVAYLSNHIFLYGAILIGLLVGKAVVMGIGKVSTTGRIMIGVLTVASVVFGDVIFFTLVVMKERNLPFSFPLMRVIVNNLGAIEGKNVASIIFALIGAAIIVYNTRKPAFKANFVPLGIPAPGVQAQPAG
jgi:hypothetical protein